jgi:hypothetical protein
MKSLMRMSKPPFNSIGVKMPMLQLRDAISEAFAAANALQLPLG